MGTTPQPTQGIELSLKDGTVIKASSVEEALKTAVKMYEDTKEWAKGQIDDTRTQLEQVRAEQQRLTEASRPKPQPGEFNKDAYYKLLNEDPVNAQNYLDAYRFGLQRPDEVPQHFQRMEQRINSFEQQALAAAFLQQHDDFPQTADAAQTLTGRLEALYNQGYPATVDTLNMAWGQLTNEGRIKPIETRPEPEEELPVSPGGGSSDISTAEMNKFESMSTDQMEKYLREKGVLR
jgi:hypothetical protein